VQDDRDVKHIVVDAELKSLQLCRNGCQHGAKQHRGKPTD
jgi:hypothetical protein